TAFQTFRAVQLQRGQSPWAPFTSAEEWELARWIHATGITQRATDDFLCGPMATQCRAMFPSVYGSFHNNKSYLSHIDKLPGPKASWSWSEITVQGNARDAHGWLMKEVLPIYHRNPVDIVEDLISYTPFDGHIAYA
ncbi:hypothetical protein FOMPIDRAFT_1084230, partial [Fomitopsis schrenkii]